MVVRFSILILSIMLLACSSNPGSKSKAKNENSGSAEIKEATKSFSDSAMVYFKSGTFMMGYAKGLPQEQPVHKVEVKSFKIDKYPVTVKAFRLFVEATGYKTDAERFGDSGVFDFKTACWTLVPGANWHILWGRIHQLQRITTL